MALKEFILYKLDHQMSKSLKGIAAHELEFSNKFDKLKNWVPDCSAQDRISAKNVLDSKHVPTVYFKPSKKNKKNIFLPLSSVLVWLTLLHLSNKSNILYFRQTKRSIPTCQNSCHKCFCSHSTILHPGRNQWQSSTNTLPFNVWSRKTCQRASIQSKF